MCREYYINFLECGHLELSYQSICICTDYPWCGSPEELSLNVDRFCNGCLYSPSLPRIRANHPINPDEAQMAHAQSILDRAPPMGVSHKLFASNNPVDPNHGDNNVYTTKSIDIFADTQLSTQEGEWLADIEKVVYERLWQKLLDANMADPTAHEVMLHLQIRRALHAHQVSKVEWERERERALDSDELVRRVESISTPVPVTDDGAECLICREVLGQPTVDAPAEEPVKLPCEHVLGKACLEIWVRGWRPGKEPVVCTLCHKGFNLLTQQEILHGTDGSWDDEDVADANPWWFAAILGRGHNL